VITVQAAQGRPPRVFSGAGKLFEWRRVLAGPGEYPGGSARRSGMAEI